MAGIKRWFPVSHDINADAEVWAMRHEVGEKALSVWLEFLSIADRNNGELPGDLEELIRLVSGRCQATKRTVRGVYDFAVRRLWLTSEKPLRLVKYLNYHRTRVTNKQPSEPSEPNLTKPIPPISPKGGRVVGDFQFEMFWKEYPKKVKKPVALKAWRKEVSAKEGLPEIIMTALRKHKAQEDWVKDGGRFIPHPSSWLNQRRWEDDVREARRSSFFTPEEEAEQMRIARKVYGLTDGD